MKITNAVTARTDLQHWLTTADPPPLLVVSDNDEARQIIRQTAADAGLLIIETRTGAEAYSRILIHRPLAVISDVSLPDMTGRELLGAVRTDYFIRETPFLLAPCAELADSALPEGQISRMLASLQQGLVMALSPQASLFNRLSAAGCREVSGSIPPIGVATLMRMLEATGHSGRLKLRLGEQLQAEVSFCRRGLVDATLRSPRGGTKEGLVKGLLAVLHIVAYQWDEFNFVRDDLNEHRMLPGRLSQLVDTACRQNNHLLSTIYSRGLHLDEVRLDRKGIERTLEPLPSDQRSVLIQMLKGEPAVALVERGLASAYILKSLLFELRCKALISFDSLLPLQAATEGLAPRDQQVIPTIRYCQRWMVVLISSLATMSLASVWLL